MGSNNGETGHGHDHEHGPLELREVLMIETKDGKELPFEVVGTLEDPDDHKTYAVLMYEDEEKDEQEFIVTDVEGNLLDDEGLAQEILDEFLLFAEEAGEGEGSANP
ncbi:MAG TPA: hypothetical protein VIG46_06500 [Candidatus Baltobacteraceae bacterium]|jgi:uncharacterized protein YrzB (UPF0473 family)